MFPQSHVEWQNIRLQSRYVQWIYRRNTIPANAQSIKPKICDRAKRCFTCLTKHMQLNAHWEEGQAVITPKIRRASPVPSANLTTLGGKMCRYRSCTTGFENSSSVNVLMYLFRRYFCTISWYLSFVLVTLNVLPNNSKWCSLVHPVMDLRLRDQCLQKQWRHNPCYLTFSYQYWTALAWNLGHLVRSLALKCKDLQEGLRSSVWYFPAVDSWSIALFPFKLTISTSECGFVCSACTRIIMNIRLDFLDPLLKLLPVRLF